MNYDSLKNQQIKGKFVEREVLCCVTDMVDYIFSVICDIYDPNAPFTEEDVENYYIPICPECGCNCKFKEIHNVFECYECDTIYEKQDVKCECFNPEFDDELNIAFKCENCGYIVEDTYDLDKEPQEVYEWWVVTPWLGRKLKEKGEPIIELHGKSIWGRRTSGQAILLDSVISEICYEMEILEGQVYEWEV